MIDQLLLLCMKKGIIPRDCTCLNRVANQPVYKRICRERVSEMVQVIGQRRRDDDVCEHADSQEDSRDDF